MTKDFEEGQRQFKGLLNEVDRQKHISIDMDLMN